jgi:hypothetical protein
MTAGQPFTEQLSLFVNMFQTIYSVVTTMLTLIGLGTVWFWFIKAIHKKW